MHQLPCGRLHRGASLTRSGRAVTEAILNAAASKPDLRTAFIDYYEPDFSVLTGAKRTAVVTHHSIEQIPEIGTTSTPCWRSRTYTAAST